MSSSPWSLLPLVSFPCSSCFKVLFNKKKLKNQIEKYTKTQILNYLAPPEAPDHLPLATLSCLTEQCSYCGKNFSRKSSLFKHMLVVYGAGLGCGKKFNTNNIINRHKTLACGKPHHRKSFCNFSMWSMMKSSSI